MSVFLVFVCILLVFGCGFYAMKELSSFLLKNRRGRKNYEYDILEEEED